MSKRCFKCSPYSTDVTLATKFFDFLSKLIKYCHQLILQRSLILQQQVDAHYLHLLFQQFAHQKADYRLKVVPTDEGITFLRKTQDFPRPFHHPNINLWLSGENTSLISFRDRRDIKDMRSESPGLSNNR